jgi:uncharacterized protein (DUF2236 family)
VAHALENEYENHSPRPAAIRRPVAPGGPAWEYVGLVTFPLVSGASFVLQTMHPSIGTVVGEHSTFTTDATGRAARSISSVMTWVYGGEEALVEAERLRAMHVPLNSTDEQGVSHKALSSGPWAWVMLTAPHSFAVASRYFSMHKLTSEETEAFYQDTVQVMRNLRVAEKEIPPTYEDYLATLDDIIENTLVAHPTAFDVLDTFHKIPPPPALPPVLHPLWRLATLGPGRLQHFVTVGTLPPKARDKLGLSWSATDEALLRTLGMAVAITLPLLPERLRYLPIAYEARRANRAQGRLRRVLDRRPR